MNNRKIKIIISAAFGMIMMGSVPAVTAQTTGWSSGDTCDSSHSSAGSKPCFDSGVGSTDYYVDQSAGNDGEWFGVPGSGGTFGNTSFEYSGQTDLSCPLASPTCELTLYGKLARFQQPDGSWTVNVEVNDADVSGGGLCGLISVSGFPWYAAPTSDHENFSPTGGVSYPFSGGDLVGNFGGGPGTDGIEVTATLLGTLVSSAHVHNVTYDNATSTFQFDSDMYEDDDTNTGCSVVGDLELQNADYVHVH